MAVFREGSSTGAIEEYTVTTPCGVIKCFMYCRQISLVREVTVVERVRKAKFHNANCCFP
jgi:hypothetical protein